MFYFVGNQVARHIGNKGSTIRHVNKIALSTSTTCTSSSESREVQTQKGGFAKALDKFTSPISKDNRPKESFLSLLRSSKLIDVSWFCWLVI